MRACFSIVLFVLFVYVVSSKPVSSESDDDNDQLLQRYVESDDENDNQNTLTELNSLKRDDEVSGSNAKDEDSSDGSDENDRDKRGLFDNDDEDDDIDRLNRNTASEPELEDKQSSDATDGDVNVEPLLEQQNSQSDEDKK